MKNKIKIGIVGVGMVGEPIRKWFEEVHGYKRNAELFCYDADQKKGYTDNVNKADIIFVSVPTPSNPDGSCDVSIVESVVKTIKDGKTIIIKSTITPGTVETLQEKFPRKKIIFNPEFLTESQVWTDFLKPDRQILGPTKKSFTETKEVLSLLPLAHFSRPWASDYSKKSVSATEAELSKYASNVFGYVKVIFGNILADITHALNQKFATAGIDAEPVEYENIREMISADPRIGPAWLNVEQGNYCGAGGYCFPKDMNALIAFIEGNLIKPLEKKAKSKDLVVSLKKANAVLKAVRDYNRSLLKWQGLTEQEVSKHNAELILSKRKPIRNRN